MARIAFAVISTNVLLNNNQQTVIENPLHTLIMPNLPNNFTFNLSFAAIELEHNFHHKLTIDILHVESGEKISDGTFEFDTLDAPEGYAHILGSMNQDLEIRNLLFKKEGLYTLLFDMNGNKHSIYFMVKKSEQE